eukprot:gnl/TRDRNA2_/TRDRNA2_202959_c0_seq1.p1 gnl/TRDRNA2_/TRDRNA2_202959_c0~~gnl/TRDRNA2_/TRDRNA2_202959_c0_seq1.p1  ORF type:complete len:241 (+),score=30.45 gnl/TRDRNA2_/TRDRNA2_202959_c0_seq1:44-724(+)
MPISLLCASGLAGLGFAGLAGWRAKSFLDRIRAYREKAKGGAKPAPLALAIQGCQAKRAAELSWFVIDDQVMGGRSSSELTMTDGCIELAGTINTNGGGFCSCRSLGDESPLGFPANTKAIEVTGIADSSMYKLNLMTGDSWSMGLPSWSHDFRGAAGVKQTWVLPLESFVPTIRGKTVQAPPLDPAAVTGVGVALSLYDMQGKPNAHFGDGPFKISIHGLKVVCS